MKKTNIFPVLLLSLFFLGQQANGQTSSLANLGAYIENWMQSVHKPGMTAIIIKGDSVIWSHNFGYAVLEDSVPVTDSTLFNAFSIGKSITAACMMHCWEQGYLGLDDNINNLLPFIIDNPYHDYDSITPRMLMSHTSSLRELDVSANATIGDPTESLGYFLENFYAAGGTYYASGNFLSQPSGSTYLYSNYGPGVTGFLAGVVCSDDFKNLCRNTIFIPLEMPASAWFLADLSMENLATGYEYSGGQYVAQPHYGHPAYPGLTLRSNTAELAHYAIMLLNQGVYKGTQVLEGTTIDTMMTVHYPQAAAGIGLGFSTVSVWTPSGSKIIWGHRGGSTAGYAAEVQVCEADNTAIVYMSNSNTYATVIRKRMLEYAAMFVIAEEPEDITVGGFTAKWQPAPDAGGYLFDLAQDESFTQMVPGYENLQTGMAVSYPVTSLPAGNYYYRLRATNDFDTGAYSNVVPLELIVDIDPQPARAPVITTSGTELVIRYNDHPAQGATARVLSVSGQLLGAFQLSRGVNRFGFDKGRQIVIVHIEDGEKSFTKKVLVW